MKYFIFFIVIVSVVFARAQENPFGDDYTYFGRKEPISIGSAFSALGSGMIPLNPADMAFRTDNRVSKQSAIAKIEEAGLELGNIIYEYSDDFTPYTVISQSIDPGMEVREKKKINLVISKLPEDLE